MQLGNGFQILRTASGALELDQLFQRDDTARHTEHGHFLRVGQQLLVGTATGHLAQQVEIADYRREIAPMRRFSTA